MGKNIRDVMKHSVTKEDTALAMAALGKGEPWSGEFIGQRKNGSKFPTIVYLSPILNVQGELTGVISISTDITKRKQSEELVLKLSSAIEQSPISILITDLNGTIEYVNPYIPKLTGYHYSELIGKNPNIFKSGIQPKAFYKKFWDTILAGKKWQGEICNKKKNGELFWEYVIISPVKNENGEIINFINISEDITERKKVMAELIDAKEQAEESNLLKSAFLANISHEIRTPMNGILGFAELLKEDGLTGDQQSEYIKIIEKSGDRMLNIINEIVDISKIESGLIELRISETNINEQIEDAYHFFKPETDKKGIQLIYKTTLPENKAILKTDREKLYAILLNLIKNAIKFTDSGKIEIGYSIKNTDKLAYVEFYVADTGIGIPIDRQEAIFKRFIQADISDRDARQGVGLGLSIAKAYANLLGGKISVESEQGLGSTFYFTLPYSPEKIIKKTVLEVITDSNYGIHKKLKILIVEDDEHAEQFLKILLSPISSELMRARNGEEAIEICKTNPDIDLVLMDIQMPVMNGYEATRQIRLFNKDVIIIAQTAFALSGDKEKAINAGCNGHISKPINKANLMSIIKKHVKKT